MDRPPMTRLTMNTLAREFLDTALFTVFCLILLLTLLPLPAHAMARRPPPGGQTQTIKLDSGFMQVVGTNRATAVQGGTISDAGLFNGPVMVESAKGQLANAQARVLIGFNFGADAAPDSAALDEKTSTLKNDLGRIIESAKANPAAAGALAGLELAGAALKPGKALPLGDRTAGQGYMLFEGESADARLFGVQAVDAFADIRASAHGMTRAKSTETIRETLTVTNDAEVVTNLGLAYIEYLSLLAMEDKEEPEASTPAPRLPDGSPDVPDAGIPQTGSNIFLWKPTSDSNGKLVVILPAALGRASTVSIGSEQGNYSATANGNRAHYRFGKPGADYGSNVAVVATFPGGRTERWTVANGGKRTEIEYKGAAVTPTNPPEGGTTNTEPAGGKPAELTATGLLLRGDVAALVEKVIVVEDAKTNTVNPPKITATRTGNAWSTGKPLSEHRAAVYQIWFTRTPPADVPHHPHFPCATCAGIVGHVTQAGTWDPDTVR